MRTLLMLCALSLAAPSLPVTAADLGASAPVTAPVQSLATRTASRLILLTLTRVRFDILPANAVMAGLKRRISGWSDPDVLVADAAMIDRDLLAEGCYFLTSIAYTIRAGGAVFPPGENEADAAANTLADLAALRDQLMAGIVTGDDLSPVFRRAESLWTLTGGMAPDTGNPFDRYESLLAAILGTEKPATWL